MLQTCALLRLYRRRAGRAFTGPSVVCATRILPSPHRWARRRCHVPRCTASSWLPCDGDAALDRFLATDHFAEVFQNGWHVRLQPLRASGSWLEAEPRGGDSQSVRPRKCPRFPLLLEIEGAVGRV